MPAQRIRQLGDPILRELSRPAAEGEDVSALLADLRDTLYEFRRTHGFGRGISAVQIGDARRVIYMEVEGVRYSLVNPVCEWMSAEKFTLWDDCFSFPNLLVKLERWQRIRIRYLDETGASRTLEAAWALAELIQHEMDHLDGVLAIDRALDRNSLATREEYVRSYASAL
jgi:peptide deformylase